MFLPTTTATTTTTTHASKAFYGPTTSCNQVTCDHESELRRSSAEVVVYEI